VSDLRDREHQRQQALLQALFAPPAASEPPAAWLGQPGAAKTLRGWQAYRAHAGAAAERALAAACPTVQQLVGEESFAALARACWQAMPPHHGDIEQWTARLPAWLASDPQLADVPYLADCARLDLAIAAAERAADATADPGSLHYLAEHDPASLRLRLAAGTQCLASAYPVVSLWHAHHGGDRAAARQRAAHALSHGEGETALVWRPQWKARLREVAADEQRWLQACLAGAALSDALDQAGPGFDFEAWLIRALPDGLLLGVERL